MKRDLSGGKKSANLKPWNRQSPPDFRAFYLEERRAKHVGGGLRFTLFQCVSQFGDSLVDLLFVPRISAEQEIIEVQPVKHDLQPNGFDGLHALKRRSRFRTGGSFSERGERVHKEQAEENDQNEAESRIKLLTDTHCKSPPLPLKSMAHSAEKVITANGTLNCCRENRTRRSESSLQGLERISIP